MRRALLALSLALALVLQVAPGASAEEPAENPTMLVFGDSMSARMVTTADQMWWGRVASQYGLTPVLSAQDGSGYWARGNKCRGTKFGERLSAIREVKPTVIVVAGGFNDTHGCDARYRKVPIKKTSSKRGVTLGMAALAAEVDKAGLPRSTVYITTPWGTEKKAAHYWMWRWQKSEAARFGFVYRTVRFNDRADTFDGIHPTGEGHRKIGLRFIAAGGIN